jgi:hypothetical protein
MPTVSAYCSGAPVWIFNGVIAASVRADPALVAELLDQVAGAVPDVFLQVSPGAHGVAELARARGMVLGEQEPLMLLEDPDRLASAGSVDGLVIRRLRATRWNATCPWWQQARRATGALRSLGFV